jgi:hypothetical protein
VNKKTILKFLLAIFPAGVLFASVASPAFAMNLVDGHGNVDCNAIAAAFQQVIELIGTLAGIVFFAMMVVGGVMILISAGNPEGVQRGQQTLIWGVVGTLIALGLVFITSTVAEEIIGAEAADIFNLQKWICVGF